MLYRFYIRDAEREEEGNLAIVEYDSTNEEYSIRIRKDCDFTALPTILQCGR